MKFLIKVSSDLRVLVGLFVLGFVLKPWLAWWAIAVTPVALCTIAIVLGVALLYTRHRKWRDVAPKMGDIWNQGGYSELYVMNVSDTGVVRLRTTHPADTWSTRATWSESSDAWRSRVRNRWAYRSGTWLK